MSSHSLLARLSTMEIDQGVLEASVNALQNSKQDNLNNTIAEEGEVLKVGSNLRRIGTKDNTLSVETDGNVIKFGVSKDQIQEKLVQVGAPQNDTTPQALLDGNLR